MQNEDGSVVLLSANNSRQRMALAKQLLTPSKDGNLGGARKKVHKEWEMPRAYKERGHATRSTAK